MVKNWRRVTLAAALTAIGLACGVAIVEAWQTPATSDALPGTFRAGADLVLFDVSVLDKSRQPVRGLTAVDFSVIEDGKPQRVVAFKTVDVPDRRDAAVPWMRNIAPDVVTNRLDANRIVVILLDDVHGPFEPSDVKATKDIAHAVVDELWPGDMAAVVYTFAQSKGQEFTSDRVRLLAAVDRFTPSGLNPKPGVSAACPRSECVATTLRHIAATLSGWPGLRKTIVYISPQAPFSIGNVNIGQGSVESNIAAWDSVPDFQQTFEAMQESNVNVYHYDPRGVIASGLDPALGMFADSTGGRSIRLTHALAENVAEMFRENSSYYMVGFQSSNLNADGRFRSVKVTVSRADADVRTRAGYYGPASTRDDKTTGASSTLEERGVNVAMAGALPTGDFPISLTAAPFAVPGKNDAAVAIATGLDVPADFPAMDTIELVARALNVAEDDLKSHGGIATTRLALTRRPGVSGAVHYDVASRLDLPPGRYDIRVAVESPATGHTGGVYLPVTVPDFAKAPLTLSGIVLGRAPASLSAANGPLADLLPMSSTTIRTFMTADRITAFLRIYQGGKSTPVPVRLATRLVDETDHAVFDATSVLGPGDFLRARTADDRFELPLARLAPGAYLLSIEASAGNNTVRRDVRLRIK